MNWTELCRANVHHYDNHPAQHNAITALLAVLAVIVMVKMPRWLGITTEN